MSDKDVTMLQELQIELPQDAGRDQSGCPAGYYRTISGQKRILRLNGRAATRAVKKVDINNFAPVGPTTRLVPLGEDVIIQMDRYADELTCKVCRGSGHSDAVCGECGGSKQWYVDASGNRDKRAASDKSLLKAISCAACMASQSSDPIRRSTGYARCVPCGATGQAGVGQSLIAQQTERVDEPTTGIVLAIGPAVTLLNRGDRVMFSKYAGDVYEYDRRQYRVMKQQYARCKVIGRDDVRVREARVG